MGLEGYCRLEELGPLVGVLFCRACSNSERCLEGVSTSSMDGLLGLVPTDVDLVAGVGTVRVGLAAAFGWAVLRAGLGDSPELSVLESVAFRGTGWGFSISSKDDPSLRVRREGGVLAALMGADTFLGGPLAKVAVVALLGLLDGAVGLFSKVVLLGRGVVFVLLGKGVVLLGNGEDLSAGGVGLPASVVEFEGLLDLVGDVGLIAVKAPPSLADLLL